MYHGSQLCVTSERGIYDKRSLLILQKCDKDKKSQVRLIMLVNLPPNCLFLGVVHNCQHLCIRTCNICCYNGNHNNVGYTGSRAQTGVPGWGSTGEARLIKVIHTTVFVHSFTGSSTYITVRRGGRGHDASVLFLNVDLLLMLPPGGYD